MALLHDLPTGVVAQVVEQLKPRLYIDFIHYLPPEVCLKILGYLDPVSLIRVTRACRNWYELALDRKLWEDLYFLEGWKVELREIEDRESRVNEEGIPHPLQNTPTPRGHPHLDADVDTLMADTDDPAKHEPADIKMGGDSSIFGGPAAKTRPSTPHSGDLDMLGGQSTAGDSSDQRPGSVVASGVGNPSRKGKEKAAPPYQTSMRRAPHQLEPPTMWMWDAANQRYRVNWKYLYTMRRRLESNWELGKFTNFQFPHPDFPEEGHGECIYSLQYDSRYLVSGSRDRTLRIWNLQTRRLARPPLVGHSGSVLCLQFDADPEEDLIVSGSSDATIVLWRFSTGELLQRLRRAHRESVLNVKFDKRILVTCSKDKTIKIFNRRPLRYGDLGYQEVDPVPRNVKNYAYDPARIYELAVDELPVIQPYTLIGSLEGHSAAVNAVQIHEREVVSASGDRHIKVWDWPTQACTRTFVGHGKGIACVQYDGRRIVSGSSDCEVKVFDRPTGLQVASLRSHSSLVRTVQAGFGDLPFSLEEDEAEAKRVDIEYFKAVEAGQLEESSQPRAPHRHAPRPGNAGSSRPEDIEAYGAKVPPGGGGGKYSRIVSGSYDTNIIIWRRDKEGIWKDQHHLKQEDAAAAAIREGRTPRPTDAVPGSIPLHPSVQPPSPARPGSSLAASRASPAPQPSAHSSSARPSSSARSPTPGNQTTDHQITPADSPIFTTLTPSSIASYRQMIDASVPQGPQVLAQVLASYPSILTQRDYLQASIDREQSPFLKGQMRQVVTTALFRTQIEQTRQRRDATRNLEQAAASSGDGGQGSSSGQASSSAQQAQQAQQVQHTLTAPAGAAVAGQGAHAANPAAAAAAVSSAATTATAAAAAAAAHQAHAQFHAPAGATAANAAGAQNPHQHPHIATAADAANAARVFKLQFDARRIICCSQTSIIVGWDFCNGDPELEEVSPFFSTVE